jgi:hypothetical protein
MTHRKGSVATQILGIDATEGGTSVGRYSGFSREGRKRNFYVSI